MGQGVWEFLNDDEHGPVLGATPTIAELKAFKKWHEKARKVMYWLSMHVLDSIIAHM